MKKFLTLLMTALLILSFAVPAMAESKTITTLSSNGGEAQLEFDKYINDKFHEMYPDYTMAVFSIIVLSIFNLLKRKGWDI